MPLNRASLSTILLPNQMVLVKGYTIFESLFSFRIFWTIHFVFCYLVINLKELVLHWVKVSLPPRHTLWSLIDGGGWKMPKELIAGGVGIIGGVGKNL